MAKNQGNEVAVPAIPRPDDEWLRDINSLDDAFAALESAGIAVRDIADEIGTGFTLADDDVKASLVGRPMVLLAWAFSPGDYGEFVTVFAVTTDGGKFIVNDGSTGICAQLSAYTAETGMQNGLRVNHGLRRSDYFIDKETKEPVPRNFEGPKEPAHTFYLDTSK